MKLFKKIKKWCDNQVHLYYLFIIVLIIPNVVLMFTESMPLLAKICNVVVPLSVYWLLMSWLKKPGKMLWILFVFIFFGAFQLVLLYLFGNSIIAVDMFLNLTTTNSGEAMELLDNLIPALVFIFIIYIPTLILGVTSIMNKESLSMDFLRKGRRYSLMLFVVGLCMLGIAKLTDKDYQLKIDLYPVNVCYNVYLAFERDAQSRHYYETSADFTFHAKSTHVATAKEIYVMVVGETSRALNWGLYGYERNTTPKLGKEEGLIVFKDALTQSNTTHKSVPILLSAASAENFDCMYKQKGILTAFKEAGFHTVFFSNQKPNNSYIDFFGMEADHYDFIKEDTDNVRLNPSDDELLGLVQQEINKGHDKLFIVLHTYGSHFNYQERYPADSAIFTPDKVEGAEVKYRSNLVNAYDNTIRYTDGFLSQLIKMLNGANVQSAMFYTSDHGEDIFDDNRHLFLHASPIPTYYQLHVPLVVWMSPAYREAYPDAYSVAQNNVLKPVSSNAAFHTVLSLGGINTSYKNDTLSVVNKEFEEKERYYLNDHNLPKALDDIGLQDEDFEMFRKMGIKY